MVWDRALLTDQLCMLSNRMIVWHDMLTVSTLCFLSELYTLMKDQDDGVRELKLEQENRVFNHCFTGRLYWFYWCYRWGRRAAILTVSLFSDFCTGATVVEWLVSKGKARNKSEAVMLATGLLSEGFLQPAGDMSKEGAESGNQAFLDHTNALYYFVSLSNHHQLFIVNGNCAFFSLSVQQDKCCALSCVVAGRQWVLLRRLLQWWRCASEGRIQRKHRKTGLLT